MVLRLKLACNSASRMLCIRFLRPVVRRDLHPFQIAQYDATSRRGGCFGYLRQHLRACCAPRNGRRDYLCSIACSACAAVTLQGSRTSLPNSRLTIASSATIVTSSRAAKPVTAPTTPSPRHRRVDSLLLKPSPPRRQSLHPWLCPSDHGVLHILTGLCLVEKWSKSYVVFVHLACAGHGLSCGISGVFFRLWRQRG